MTAIDRHLTPADLAASLRTDVRAGLAASPKVLPPKYFYDGRGSELFEAITQLPEYYQTRAEASILTARAAEIADLTKARSLVELGSGSSEKTHLLLHALRDVGSLASYVPVDVSADAIEWALPGLVESYPGLDVHGVVADFERHLDLLPADGPRLVAFLGGTIGNFEPEQRAAVPRRPRRDLASRRRAAARHRPGQGPRPPRARLRRRRRGDRGLRPQRAAGDQP